MLAIAVSETSTVAMARRAPPPGIKDVLCQPLGSFGCQDVPGGARIRPGGTSPGSPWRPRSRRWRAAQRARVRARPAARSAQHGTRQPPQRRRAAETVNDVKLVLGALWLPGQRRVQEVSARRVTFLLSGRGW